MICSRMIIKRVFRTLEFTRGALTTKDKGTFKSYMKDMKTIFIQIKNVQHRTFNVQF